MAFQKGAPDFWPQKQFDYGPYQRTAQAEPTFLQRLSLLCSKCCVCCPTLRDQKPGLDTTSCWAHLGVSNNQGPQNGRALIMRTHKNWITTCQFIQTATCAERQQLPRHGSLLLVHHHLYAGHRRQLSLCLRAVLSSFCACSPEVLVTFLIAVVMAIFAGVKAMIVAGCGQVYVLEAGPFDCHVRRCYRSCAWRMSMYARALSQHSGAGNGTLQPGATI